MPHSIDIDVRPAYLYARMNGSNTPETILSYMLQIVDLCEAHDRSLVLIHDCLDGPSLSMIELFETISQASRNVLGRFDAVAYCDDKMGHLMGFGEDVAVNRGMPLAAFDNLDEATSWILAQYEDLEAAEELLRTVDND